MMAAAVEPPEQWSKPAPDREIRGKYVSHFNFSLNKAIISIILLLVLDFMENWFVVFICTSTFASVCLCGHVKFSIRGVVWSRYTIRYLCLQYLQIQAVAATSLVLHILIFNPFLKRNL